MKFRKKPVVIEAVPLNSDNFSIQRCIEFVGPNLHGDGVYDGDLATTCDIVRHKGLQIITLEGTMTASMGDWIIKGVNGEFYPCKPDVFVKTYEPVEA